MSDFKTTTIYGDLYVNNKVGINTTTPATRLQIGQLSPTATTEGIQFGDDPGTRIYRSAAGTLTISGSLTSGGSVTSTYGSFSSPGLIIGDAQYGFYVSSGNVYYKSASGGSHFWRNIANNTNILSLDNSGNLTTVGNLTANGNTYLGDGNGDLVHINDILHVGATDSGDSHLYFGEGSTGNIQYGAHLYWDSGYTFYWYTRNNGTDTQLFDYVTNDTSYINWRRHFHMQNKEANYFAQVHFNAGTRFVGNNTNYLTFRSDATNAGGIIMQDGSSNNKGYIGYWDSAGGGILNNTGNWAVRYNFGSTNTGGQLYGDWTIAGLYTTGDYEIRNTSPTITFRDTDNRTGFIHVNSNIFYVLTGVADSARGNWAQVANSRWPMELNLSNNNATFGADVNAISFTGTYLTGAYQNTTVYDSAKTQSATPNKGVRAYASSIQFTDSLAIAPYWTYRSTGDWPVPYGIGWGTGGESSGIFQRFASNGYSLGDMIFYTGNDGQGAFSFRRHTWEGTTHFAAGSGELATELFRVDWSGNLSMLGTLNGTAANSATLYANNGSYGSWKIGGTRNGWYGIEFESAVSLMANSGEVGFYRSGAGWQMRWYNGSGYIYKGNPGGGTEATILDSSNYTTQVSGILLKATGLPPAYGDWNSFGNLTQTTNGIVQEYFNLGSGTGNSNFPPVVAYNYGILLNFGSNADARAQIYISHAGNDLIFRGGWGTASWQTWNKCLTNINQPYAYAMNQYVRTSDVPTFSGVYTSQVGINDGGMDCYINITDSNPAFNNETYGGEFYFYGDKDRASSLLYVGGIDASRTIIASAISSRDYTRQIFPNGGYFYAGGSQTGAIKIKMYTGSKSVYPMLSFTCHIYNYSEGTSRTFKIGGHYSNTAWYNVFAYCLGDGGGSLDVRFGYEGTNLCVWIGETNSGWSYPTVFITDFQNGYSAIDGNWMTGWTISLATAFDTVTNGPYTPGRFWNQKNDGAGSGLDADLVDGLEVHTARNDNANKIVRTDSNGYIQAGWINTTSGDNSTTAIDRVYASSDAYIRYYTPANFRTVLDVPTRGGTGASGTWAISINGSSAQAGCINSDTGNVGGNRLQYWQLYESTPSLNPTADWYTAIRMGHGDPVTYYGNTLAVKMTGTNLGDIYTRTLTNGTQGVWNRFWNDNNDGAGSGLDADLLDGYNSATANTVNTIVLRDGSGNFSAGTITAALNGNAATATTTDNINGRAFYNRDSGNVLGQDSYTNNGVGYVNSVSLFSQTDGGMYASAYSTSWVHQIYGDFRTGQIAIRGKNNGTWQAWRTVLDSSNYNSFAAALNGATNQNFSANAIYPYEWIRFMSNAGVYWQSGTYAGWHIYPQTLWGMSFRSAGTDCGLQLRKSDNGVIGSVYSDGTSIGFLDASNGWGASWTLAGVMNRGSVPGSLVTGNISGNAATATSAASCTGNAATATSISGYNNPTTAATVSTIAYRDANADLTTRYFLANRTTAAAGQCGIQLQTGGTSKWWMYLRTNDDANLVFYTSNSPADDVVRMSSTGMGVKIDPSNRLHVNGPGTSPASNTAHCAIRVDNTGATGTEVGSNSRNFAGWLPISVDGNLRWIRIFS